MRDRAALFVRQRCGPTQGMWTLPGGFVERDETLDEAVVREVREETGLTVVCQGVVALRQRVVGEANDLFVVLQVVENSPQEPRPDGHEVDSVHWFTDEELARRDDIGKTARYIAWHALSAKPHVLPRAQNPYWDVDDAYQLFLSPR